MAAKSKARYVFNLLNRSHGLISVSLSTIIVRMISTAQTGFFYTTQRLRQGPTLAAVKYDPKGEYHLYIQEG
ncbi:hypothetical protein C8Q75DRAFT_715134 [Abortiporus biennis]|nr:hypothetical protein C8Q75DRAFT_715134 [Abortiporus biennis]